MKDSNTNKFHFPSFSKIIPWLAIALLIIWIVQLYFIYNLGNKLQNKINKQNIAQQQRIELKQSQQLINQHQAQINILSQSFPDEIGVIQFVRLLKNQLSPYQSPQVNITDNQPIQASNNLAPLLPVSFSATATPSAFTNLMNQITQNKYLLQPVSLEITAPQGLSQPATLNYKTNLYISKDFLK